MNNNIQFLQTGGVPLTNDLMATIQEAYQLFEVLGDVAGHLTILKGCEADGSTTNPGIVAINGEIFPFEGGLTASTVYIYTEEIEKTFEDQQDKVLIEKKTVKFGNAVETFNWEDFKSVPTLRELAGHTHDWSDIENKPSTFPPSEHTHTWNEIEEKPTEFPPEDHTHDWNDIENAPAGKIVMAGRIGHNPRRVIKRFVGYFTVGAVPNQNNCFHRIYHNIGHTNYVVLAHAVQPPTIKANCFEVSANYCSISTSDDHSANPSDFQFVILEF